MEHNLQAQHLRHALLGEAEGVDRLVRAFLFLCVLKKYDFWKHVTFFEEKWVILQRLSNRRNNMTCMDMIV